MVLLIIHTFSAGKKIEDSTKFIQLEASEIDQSAGKNNKGFFKLIFSRKTKISN